MNLMNTKYDHAKPNQVRHKHVLCIIRSNRLACKLCPVMAVFEVFSLSSNALWFAFIETL